MANLNEERNDQGFNNIRNSSMDKREKKGTLRAYTFLGIIILTAILIATLLVTAIGAIIANVAEGNQGKPSHKNPSGNTEWTEIVLSDADTKAGPLVLVNKTHEYTFPAKDDHLASINDKRLTHNPRVYLQSGLSTYMESTALDALDRMLVDFHAATGKDNVLLKYAYRDYESQKDFSTAPGFSDHHTGFGIQLVYQLNGRQYDLSADPAYAWITENCYKYGFVVRYPDAKADVTEVSDYESYFRYVGVAHATYMTANDLCMEEYIDLLSKQENPLKVTDADGNKYEIYYFAVKGNTKAEIPDGYTYTVSGTNDGGVVVTVNLSKAPATTETTTETASANGQS